MSDNEVDTDEHTGPNNAFRRLKFTCDGDIIQVFDGYEIPIPNEGDFVDLLSAKINEDADEPEVNVDGPDEYMVNSVTYGYFEVEQTKDGETTVNDTPHVTIHIDLSAKEENTNDDTNE